MVSKGWSIKVIGSRCLFFFQLFFNQSALFKCEGHLYGIIGELKNVFEETSILDSCEKDNYRETRDT